MLVVSRNLLIVFSLSLVLVSISLFTCFSQLTRWVGAIGSIEKYY